MEFHRFFDAKVASVRASTADAPPPTFTAVRSGCSFQHFYPITVDYVAAAIRALPDKQCSSDPIATRFVKDTVDVLAPYAPSCSTDRWLPEWFHRRLKA